jgi:hypothetical protein
MSMDKLAYARIAYQSFSRSARHVMQIISSHQSLETGWAYLSYATIAFEVSLTARRVMQLVALLEAGGVLEVRRGHGRGNVNFYRILREEDGLPVPHQTKKKKVKSATPIAAEKVKFPTPPAEEKVKSETGKGLEMQENTTDKVVTTKERKEKEDAPSDRSPEKAERLNPFWCEVHGFIHSERLPDGLPGAAEQKRTLSRPVCWTPEP